MWSPWYLMLEDNLGKVEYKFYNNVISYYKDSVATPLWDKCEGEAHTPKSGKLESSRTPENSELYFRGQISLQSSFL
jgi:hypothetical protein